MQPSKIAIYQEIRIASFNSSDLAVSPEDIHPPDTCERSLSLGVENPLTRADFLRYSVGRKLSSVKWYLAASIRAFEPFC